MNMCIIIAKTLGVKTIVTEHTHFLYHDVAGVHLNKILKWSMSDVDASICVSQACKENFTLRIKMNPNICFTIPNAVDTNKFQPNPSLRFPINRINIVCVSRLTTRKGIDLLIDIIPKIIEKYKTAYFIIGGDGEKTDIIKKLIKIHSLEDSVELLGAIPHKDVCNVMNRGHIFLNTSLTETFCLSMLEAASCGLLVVSTNVGGIPEVLPPGMAYLAQPNAISLTKELLKAIRDYDNVQSSEIH